MKKRLCSVLLALLLLAGLLAVPAGAAGSGPQYGLVITVDVWQSPAKLGVLLDGDGGILWADFTGAVQDYASGMVVQVGEDRVASPAVSAPSALTVHGAGTLFLPTDTVRVPAGFTLTLDDPVRISEGGAMEVAGHLILNNELIVPRLEVRSGGWITANAPLRGDYVPIFDQSSYSAMLNIQSGARFDGTALMGLDPSLPGTYYYDLTQSWWIRELEPEEQQAARDPQAVVERNRVALDSDAARRHYLEPEDSRTGGREMVYYYDHPEILQLAQDITGGSAGERARAEAIYRWVAENIWYDMDYYHYQMLKRFPGSYDDQWSMAELERYAEGFTIDPLEVLEGRHTVCDGYVRLTADLLRAAGIPARWVANSTQPSHAWTEAYVDGEWIALDTTFGSRNVWEDGGRKYTQPCDPAYFDVSDQYHTPALEDAYIPSAGYVVDSGLLVSGGVWGEVTLPDTVRGIGAYALASCGALEKLTVPQGVRAIQMGAFENCTSLTQITLPQDLAALDLSAFDGCTALREVVIPAGVTQLQGTLLQKDITLVSASDYVASYAQARGLPFRRLEAPSAWAQTEVEAAIAAGLVPEDLQCGYTGTVTRGAVAELFIRLLERSTGKEIDVLLAERGVEVDPTAFTDTWDEDVLAANALGIINGVGNRRFDPEGSLTRAQIAAILNRAAAVLGVKTEGYSHDFTDVSGHWVETELGWPVYAGVINGVGDNRFDPDGVLTTEQSIVIAQRALQALT